MCAIPSSEPGVLDALHTLVKENRLHQDEQQEAAARSLDALRARLQAESTTLQRLRHALLPSPMHRGLYLFGPPGRGKSMLMDLFYRSIESTHGLATLPRRRVHFLHFMQETHAGLESLQSRRSIKSPIETWARKVAKQAKLLCFDELVIEDIADAMVLGRLFASLLQHKTTLVATSNFAPHDLYKDGLQRENFLPFLKLLERHTEIVALQRGADYRHDSFQEIAAMDMWFGAPSAMSIPRMQRCFERLAEHDSLSGARDIPCPSSAVRIERCAHLRKELRLPSSNATLGWVAFAELCDRPRGTRDYHTLAEHFGLLFVFGTPTLSESERNEAKRLMRLVDVFYEQGSLLLLGAEASSPETLYSGYTHKKEFARAVSRIMEMAAEAKKLWAKRAKK